MHYFVGVHDFPRFLSYFVGVHDFSLFCGCPRFLSYFVGVHDFFLFILWVSTISFSTISFTISRSTISRFLSTISHDFFVITGADLFDRLLHGIR